MESNNTKGVTLEKLPSGSLFEYKGCIALKSEYRTDSKAVEAYILGSGEMFWGGVDTPEQLNKLLVTPIKYKP